MAAQKIYRAYRNGTLIAEDTAEELEKLIGCKRKTIRKYALMGFVLKKEYAFEEVDSGAFCELKPEVMNPFQVEEWERVTRRLLNSGIDLSKCVLVPEPNWR